MDGTKKLSDVTIQDLGIDYNSYITFKFVSGNSRYVWRKPVKAGEIWPVLHHTGGGGFNHWNAGVVLRVNFCHQVLEPQLTEKFR